MNSRQKLPRARVVGVPIERAACFACEKPCTCPAAGADLRRTDAACPFGVIVDDFAARLLYGRFAG